MARLGRYALILWVALTLNFLLPRLMPGTPLALLAGADVAELSGDQRARLLADQGLDRPLVVQYVHYVADLARGDLGHSFQRGAPVLAVLGARLPWTLLLTATSQALAIAIGFGLGVVAAWHHRRGTDVGVISAVMLLESLPVFWVGMLLLALFAVQLPLFPSFGAVTPWLALDGADWLRDVARHLVLPAATLTMASVSSTFLTARSAATLALAEPFVAAARARGLRGRRVLLTHVVPNALLPVVTAAAMNVAFAIGGATLVETVFSYPGLGRLIYESVVSRDFPMLQGAFLLTTVIVVLTNLALDLAYPWLDPRLRDTPRRTSGDRA